MYTTPQKIQIIQAGFTALKYEHGYAQKKVVDKLIQLNHNTNKSSFNKILNNNGVGEEVVTITFKGMIELLKKECCLKIDKELKWVKIPDCEAQPVLLPEDNISQLGFLFTREGRLHPEEKVQFFQTATTEMVEFGTTLNAFSNYLVSLRESLFKEPLLELLRKGVNVKCYLLDPDWNGTSFYFENRISRLEKGQSGIEKIRNSLRRLKFFHEEVKGAALEGKFEVFTYRHFPHNYFLAIDTVQKSSAKMMISNYLYGIPRASCPVLEFTRQSEPLLFSRYEKSLQLLTKTAKSVDFSKI